MKKRSIHGFTSQGVHHLNQDVFGYSDNVIWVLDGATPLFGDDLLGGNDVQNTMRRINALLEECYDHSGSFAINLSRACRNVQSMYRAQIPDYDVIPAYKLPTFAGAAAEVKENILTYYVIGDCEIRYGQSGWIVDESFRHVNQQNKQDEARAVQAYRSGHHEPLSTDELYQQKLRYCRWQRSRLNMEGEGGYWIGSLDTMGIPHGKSGSVQIKDTDSVYVYCDGMAHLIEKNPQILMSSDILSAIKAVRSETDDDVTVVWNCFD